MYTYLLIFAKEIQRKEKCKLVTYVRWMGIDENNGEWNVTFLRLSFLYNFELWNHVDQVTCKVKRIILELDFSEATNKAIE